MNDKKVICVLGMHRSGTSMVTRILNICGACVGPEEELLGSGDGNDCGHWENREILKINDDILSIFGGAWNDPPNFPYNWEEDPRLDHLYEEANIFVKKMNAMDKIWAFKDPRTCLTLPFWKKIIPHMLFVIPVRDSMEVAMSLSKRDKSSIESGLFLWKKYWMSILKNTKGENRIFTIQKNYFADWKKELQNVIDFIDSVDIDIIGNEKEIKNFISPKLNNNKIVVSNIPDELNGENITKYILDEVSDIFDKIDGKIFSEIQEKGQKITDLSNEIETMKASKFWKLRDQYMRIKNSVKFALLSFRKFIKKYLKI
ncbi:MAG: sulfotransferase [Parcubacteria group bacterium]|jgi:hypothetical protein